MRESLGESLKKWLVAIVHCYFTPLLFEERLYEFLGIRIFKKYLPTTGDLVMQRFFKQTMLKNGKTATLVTYAQEFTILCEVSHLVGFVLYLYLFCVLQIWIAVTVNLLMNVYPIMLQRYNRARIYRLLKKREHREIATATLTTEALHA